MDQAIRNKLRSVVTQCRRLLEESIAQQLQGRFDIYATGKKDEVKAEDDVPLGHLTDEERQARQDILAHFKHIEALGYKPKESLEQLIREIAFTHLNRLCAYKMMEVRDVYVGGQRFREAVSKGLKSQGFLFYLADHPDDEKRYNAGDQEEAYRHFLNWLGGTLSQEIGVLFSPTDPANRVYPPQRVLDEVLDLLNSEELKGIWSEDETIGWVYQYFTPKELRDQARKESQAPRNSYELAFRNQFFTPRYVVEFLTDNTLGRIWYEMRKGDTRLKDECRYMVRRPAEVFLRDRRVRSTLPRRMGKDGGIGRLRTLPEATSTTSPILAHHDGYELDSERDCRVADRQLGVRQGAERQRPGRTRAVSSVTSATGASDGRPVDVEATQRSVPACSCRSCDALQGTPATAVYIPHRPKKDPERSRSSTRPAAAGTSCSTASPCCWSSTKKPTTTPIWAEPQADYPTRDDLRRAVPGLILRHNLHGIDIDLRCTQIAALALWLRCQRAYQEMGLKKDRPPIPKSNIVCAEPMPGEKELLDEFLKTLRDDHLEALIRHVMQVPDGTRSPCDQGDGRQPLRSGSHGLGEDATGR